MPNSQLRQIDPSKRLRRLEQKHAELKERVAAMEERSYLSSAEQLEKRRLKKKKLAAKDELSSVRREMVSKAY